MGPNGDEDRGPEPSLADDERRLADLSDALRRGVLAAIPGWMARTVETRLAEEGRMLDPDGRARIDAAARDLVDVLAPSLAAILAADVDAGAGSPLALLRAHNRALNELLDGFGVRPPVRDRFAIDRFPEDRHDVGPMTFADLAPALHDPGIVWGAARAHVHLRRRRETEAEGTQP